MLETEVKLTHEKKILPQMKNRKILQTQVSHSTLKLDWEKPHLKLIDVSLPVLTRRDQNNHPNLASPCREQAEESVNRS